VWIISESTEDGVSVVGKYFIKLTALFGDSKYDIFLTCSYGFNNSDPTQLLHFLHYCINNFTNTNVIQTY
jgi:hypothetical protein